MRKPKKEKKLLRFSTNKNVKPLNRFTPKTGSKKEKTKKKTEELWDKILRHRTDIMIRVGIVIVVLLLATGFFYFRYLNKEYTQVSVVKSESLVVTMGSEVMRFGNHLLIYSNDGMKCVNEKGQVVWNETFQMQNQDGNHQHRYADSQILRIQQGPCDCHPG